VRLLLLLLLQDVVWRVGSSFLGPLKPDLTAPPHFVLSLVRTAAALQDVVWRVGSSFLSPLKPDFMDPTDCSLYLVCIVAALQDEVRQFYCPAQARLHS
jgi:hypothetical protein